MIRGTTPTIEITTDISLVQAEEIYVTIKQGDKVVEHTKDTLNVTDEAVTFTLTQEETLALQNASKSAAWQVRAKFPDGTAVACEIGSVRILPILKEGVI